MDKNDFFFFGTVTKVHGKDGVIAVNLHVEEPEMYEDVESVFIELNRSLVPFFVEENNIRANIAYIKLEGIDSPDTANELIQALVYLPISILAPIPELEFHQSEIIGFKVIDATHGDLGIVETILQMPRQHLMQIKKDDTEILIPLVNSFIQQIDKENKIVHVNTPEGLVDVYLNK